MHDASDSQPAAQTTELRLRATVGDREELSFLTADGVCSPEAFRTPELRLLDVLAEDPPDSLLVPEANYGVVGTVMAGFADHVWMTETSARRARLCRRNAARNGVGRCTSVAIAGTPRGLPASVEAAALAPAAYEPCAVVEQRIADTLSAIVPGGALQLAADVKAGARRYERTLRALAGSVEVVDDRGTCRVLRGRRPVEYDPPRYAHHRTLRTTIAGTRVVLVSYPGLFSASALDDGTAALAAEIDVADGERVLDLACGYGPLGVYAALAADCDVVLTDDSIVATRCARYSADRNETPIRTVATADGVAGVRGLEFDRILCNPPTHAGDGVLDSLVSGSHDVLAPDGRLDLVHHRGIGFESYLAAFGRVDRTTRGDYVVVTASP